MNNSTAEMVSIIHERDISILICISVLSATQIVTTDCLNRLWTSSSAYRNISPIGEIM